MLALKHTIIMKRSKVSYIKRAQRASFLQHQVGSFFVTIMQDEPSLATFTLTRVELSDKGGMCNLFFMCAGGKKEFEEKFNQLVVYKPGLRHALSKALNSRYCPDLMFKYDETLEKVEKIERLLDSLKESDTQEEQ